MYEYLVCFYCIVANALRQSRVKIRRVSKYHSYSLHSCICDIDEYAHMRQYLMLIGEGIKNQTKQLQDYL